MYVWIKALHIVFMVTWFAGLFYLPRLFVYHAAARDTIGIERFKIMERKLFYGIMTPGALLTVIFGIWLMFLQGSEWISSTTWLHLKLALVLILVAYHAYLGVLVGRFKNDANSYSHVFYRWLNEFPVLILILAVVLAVVKPVF